MKRRTFLQSILGFIVAPFVPKIKSQGACSPIYPAYWVKIVRYKSLQLFHDLKRISARKRYYHEQHKKRWEKRYKQKYPNITGEFGTIGSIRWIES